MCYHKGSGNNQFQIDNSKSTARKQIIANNNRGQDKVSSGICASFFFILIDECVMVVKRQLSNCAAIVQQYHDENK